MDSLAHRSAFREPLYRSYFPTSCFSTLGSWLIRFLFGWSAWELTYSAFWVGVAASAMLLPTMILSPLFGIVSDRINPRNGMIVTLVLYALVAALTGVADALGWLSLPWLITLATLLGATSSAHAPIRLALIPRLVRRQALPSAIGYSAMIFNTSRIIGPALGAWLVAGFSVSLAFFVASGMCMIAIPPLLRIQRLGSNTSDQSASFIDELKAGFVYAATHPSIRLVLGLTLLNGLLGRTLLELLPAFSGQLLAGGAKTLAILSATAGVGSIIGGLFVSRQGGDSQWMMRLVSMCLLAAIACLLVVQWLDGLTQLCSFIFVLSMFTTIAGTGTQALAQLMVDEAYRGRVLSLWIMLAMGAPALGAVLIGALAQSWGFPLVAAATALAALMVMALTRALTR